jgi:hypothetical protein
MFGYNLLNGKRVAGINTSTPKIRICGRTGGKAAPFAIRLKNHTLSGGNNLEFRLRQGYPEDLSPAAFEGELINP